MVYKELGCANSFTCEASFLGTEPGDASPGAHLNQPQLRMFGAQLCEAIATFLLPDKVAAARA